MNKTYRYQIEVEDPDTGKIITEIKDFTDGKLSASDWAEDYAYAKADKGWHRVTCIKRVL